MLYPSIIKDPIQGLHRVLPTRIELPDQGIRLLTKTNNISNLEKFQPLVHNPPIYSSPESEPQVTVIPSFSEGAVLFIHYSVHLPVLDSQGAGTKPVVLPKPHSLAIPYTPSITHFCSLSCPHHPFPKGDACLSWEQKILGEQVLYLESIISLHGLFSLSWYLWIHEAKRHIFRFLRSGIPKPQCSFLKHRDWILDKWTLCLSSVSS
jgi:hypothetical protein